MNAGELKLLIKDIPDDVEIWRGDNEYGEVRVGPESVKVVDLIFSKKEEDREEVTDTDMKAVEYNIKTWNYKITKIKKVIIFD